MMERPRGPTVPSAHTIVRLREVNRSRVRANDRDHTHRMLIEHATLADARAVARIHVDAWRAAYASVLPADFLAALSVDERQTMWRESIAAGTPTLLVARDHGAVAGWLSVGPSRDGDAPAGRAEIWALYVDPGRWSTGTGRALWAHAGALLREQGCTTCSLWVFARNERALRFYRAAGFVQESPVAKTFELGGAAIEEVRFVARLSSVT